MKRENVFFTEPREPHPVMKYCVTIPMILDTTQNSARPLGKLRVKKANIRGNSHTIILVIDCCLGSAVGTLDIFCSTHIETATRMGSMKYPFGGTSGTARFSHRKCSFRGTAWCTAPREYSLSESPSSSSGVAASAFKIDWYSAIQMGSCSSMGPRQPSGLTPLSLYSFIISCCSCCLSLPYLSCSAFILGCSDCIDLVDRSCLRVNGSIARRTMITSMMMAMPKLSKNASERMMRKLSIGSSRTVFHRSTSPYVKETMIRAAAMRMMMMVFLLRPNAGRFCAGLFTTGGNAP